MRAPLLALVVVLAAGCLASGRHDATTKVAPRGTVTILDTSFIAGPVGVDATLPFHVDAAASSSHFALAWNGTGAAPRVSGVPCDVKSPAGMAGQGALQMSCGPLAPGDGAVTIKADAPVKGHVTLEASVP